MTLSYRKIWEAHYGPIPKDQIYDIHHIDGDRSNNDISNLRLVTPREHYDIHYAQGDWAACYILAQQRLNKNLLNVTPEELSNLASKAAKKRVANGTHHFLIGGPREDLKGDNNPMRRPDVAKKLSDKTAGVKKSKKHCDAMKKGAKHRPLISCIFCKIVTTGQNFKKWHGDYCLANPDHKLKNRITNFTINNPSSIKKQCEHCNKIISSPNYSRYHGDKCKEKNNVLC